jgi:putative ABC transport system substrate-binding protein
VKRREFIFLASGAVVAWPAVAVAQARSYRVGLLAVTSGLVPEHQAFFDALTKLGYREGQNLAVERRFAAGDDSRLPALAADLVRAGVDVIVVQSSTAIRAAKNATQTIPIVMGSCADAVGNGLVASLARPGGNVTGTSFQARDWDVKHVQLLSELRPGATRFAFLANFFFLPEPAMYKEMAAAATSRGAELRLYDVRHPEDYERAFASMQDARIEGLSVAPNGVFREHRREITALAAAHRMLAVYGSRDFVDAGGLVSYGIDFPALWRRAADYVDKIFKGAKPADLPIEQPSKFEFVINLKTAKSLGVDIPQALLAQAGDLIE